MAGTQDEWRGNAHRRRKAYAVVLAKDPDGNPPACWLCGGPGADTVDHVLSQRDHPELVWDYGNMRPAHDDCNKRKGADAAPLSLGPQSRRW